jgi:hypothetical protein
MGKVFPMGDDPRRPLPQNYFYKVFSAMEVTHANLQIDISQENSCEISMALALSRPRLEKFVMKIFFNKVGMMPVTFQILTLDKLAISFRGDDV